MRAFHTVRNFQVKKKIKMKAKNLALAKNQRTWLHLKINYLPVSNYVQIIVFFLAQVHDGSIETVTAIPWDFINQGN